MKKRKNKPSIIYSSKGLVIKNLTKSFKNKPIVRNINIDVSRGEVVGLLGPNGAGKTTCFFLIMGLISPDYGTIKLNNQEITNYPVHLRSESGLGYLPQESSIFKGMTVEDY